MERATASTTRAAGQAEVESGVRAPGKGGIGMSETVVRRGEKRRDVDVDSGSEFSPRD